jgi:glucoamylase
MLNFKYSVFHIVIAAVLTTSGSLVSAQNKYEEQLKNSVKNLQANLHRSDITAGVVIASPSTNSPNYFYHWVRDAGLTMLEVTNLYRVSLNAEEKKIIEQQIRSWIQFETQNQNVALQNSTLGEPIFTVRGAIYPYPWGRPQNDGPAIRALAMLNYIDSLIGDNRSSEVSQFYRAEMPANSVVKRDLEYVAHHWNDQGFDLWEEVKGLHFFSRMAQQAALVRGAKLADRMNDPGAAAYYRTIATSIRKSIHEHVNQGLGYIVPTLSQTDGWRHKSSQLDVSILLASLYFSSDDEFFGPEDQWVKASADKLENAFIKNYPINGNTKLAPAIGRYPEDVYNGSGSGEGNPWFLATAAYAEFYCRLAKKSHVQKDSVKFNDRARGYLDRIIYHSGPNGHMSEQFNRHNGYNQGAVDLTWGYVSYIRAFRACVNSKSDFATLSTF